MWDISDWSEFDIIHFFGFNEYLADAVNNISRQNENIVLSPILDPDYNINKLRFYSRWGSKRFALSNRYFALRKVMKKIKHVYVRSAFEKEYMVRGFGFSSDVCHVVPLSLKQDYYLTESNRKPFCFHLSLLADDRKNVRRLIEAAKKFKFHLVLGGKIRSKKEYANLMNWIDDSEFIEYVGYLSTSEIKKLYHQAKVFALPSLNEGVGIVAIEAAASGCEMVITSLGGPKEYYNKMCCLVNPYSIDEIGKAVKSILDGKFSFQPELSKFVQKNFSIDRVGKILISNYKRLHL